MKEKEDVQEALYMACKITDMNDPAQATALVQTLAIVILGNLETMAAYEKKIQETLTVKEYDDWLEKEIEPMVEARTKDDMEEILRQLGEHTS